MHTEKDLTTCIEEIAETFLFDSIVLLDRVLEDDPHDPQYSANTACSRLEKYLRFESLYHKTPARDLPDFLAAKGYSKKDVALLRRKQKEENERNS